jgi:hypothetical protein
MNRRWVLLSAAWVLSSAAAPAQTVNQIVSLSPTSAVQGASGLTVTFTLDSDAPPAPPAGISPSSVTLGGLAGSAVTHTAQTVVTAVFTIPAGEAVGAKDASIVFPLPSSGTLTFSKTGAFTVLSSSNAPPQISVQPVSGNVQEGFPYSFSVAASGAAPLRYQWQRDGGDLAGATATVHTIAAVSASGEGDYACVVSNAYGSATSAVATLTLATAPPYPGYNLFAPLGSTNTHLMDNDGHIVHTWASGYRPGNAVYLLEDGTLLRTGNTGGTNLNNGGAGGRIERLDWDGNVLWACHYTGANYRAHHDVAPMPNGHILVIAWERKSYVEAVAAGRDPALLAAGELWADHVVEIAPTGTWGGEIVWEWHVWDHLIQDHDNTKAHYDVVADHPERIDLNFASASSADWNHINAIAYNAELDQILLSVREFSEVWIIDHGTTTGEAAGSTGGRYGRGGDLLYRWGNPQAYGAGTSADQQLFVQHHAQWIADDCPGAGNLLVFNNGQGRGGGNWSTVDEIAPPLAADGSYSNALPYAPAHADWSYTGSPPASFYAANISGAQRLPNGHTLVCDGPTGRFFEVTADGETVWSYALNESVFRVTRHGYDYAGLAGTDLNPGDHPGWPFEIVDTGQTNCHDNTVVIAPPAPGAHFAGQDAQYAGASMSYLLSADGKTVYDQRTGLTWTRSPDLDTNGVINAADKLTQTGAVAYAETLSDAVYGGYADWRVPSMKELYSLMNFGGADVSGPSVTNPRPFVDTNYFAFGYGDTNAGDRFIDAQFATTTLYVDTVMTGQEAMFGLNLADGRIKGYPTSGKSYYVYFVRGNTNYGANSFLDNGDGTVLDLATGLQWQQADSGAGLRWSNALAYAGGLSLGGYQDWRLPNAKELQSIVDYTRAPGITGTAAIDPVFSCSPITNEAGVADYPWYWSSTTHENYSATPGDAAVYVCFGRSLGYMNGSWQDVHGAGSQRSDEKGGSLSDWTYTAYGYYSSLAPQGDAVRLFNHVRCVRGGASTAATDTDGDGLSDWYEYDYATNATALAAGGDPDGDGVTTLSEAGAGTSPAHAASALELHEFAGTDASALVVQWPSVLGRTYRIESSTHLEDGAFTPVASGIAAVPPMNSHTASATHAAACFRIAVE